ncbi:RNA polymerase sigma-70 factor, ECF subfamily [Anaerocolumna jejuensis DSM 15929]|uniref:RNA polymerase sigma-70 factor, ECF subfamily n=1 Tax=Anaerocolumna jejuensis DSM 15929 TaxID=1121322 RepID=A0A1M6QN80_9FIRM|nr:RNA polymerase sigma factor [Anaerocolumna jejuensis]SHK21732.1 RNA polymerase sigma-70 factor, ECF subfamily [Anaerocolumna jejuensis DSM 15929]
MSADIQEEYDKIYRYCYFKVGNSTLAEDLAQETFLKYFAQNSYIEHGKKLAYLYTIARNLCLDAFRKKQPEELTDVIPDAENSFERLELNIAIRQVLKTLPEQERELLLFRYVNELSVGEIAVVTGISRFAVYRRTNSALASLKALLKEEDFL